MAFKRGDRKPAGSGRKRGQVNRLTADLKSAVLAAFDAVGGPKYLVEVAKSNPAVFCALLGRVLPLTVAGDPMNPVRYALVELSFDQQPSHMAPDEDDLRQLN